MHMDRLASARPVPAEVVGGPQLAGRPAGPSGGAYMGFTPRPATPSHSIAPNFFIQPYPRSEKLFSHLIKKTGSLHFSHEGPTSYPWL